MNKYLLSLIFGIFLLSSVSALTIIPSVLTVNKTIGTPTSINFQILNTNNFTMYNITFSDASILNLPKIPSLNPGSYINVSADVVSNTQGFYNLDLQGFYINNLGTSNNIYQVNVTSNSVNDCDKTIIYGDTIRWYSSVLDPIVLTNADNGIPVEGGTINTNQTFSLIPNAGVLRYYFTRSGFQFVPTCTLTVLNTTGLVNNPQYDGNLQLTLLASYPPTSISYSTPITSYNLTYSGSTDGIMSITNTGNNLAHVNLSGNWFSFNPNNFDLNVGQTKGIIYTINPLVLTTDQTGITHVQNITISGNFGTQVIPISVFINYADLSANSTLTNASLDAAIKDFCSRFPDFCSNPVIIKYLANASSLGVNVTVTQDTINGVWAAIFSMKDMFTTYINDRKQKDTDQSQALLSINDSVSNISVSSQQSQESNSNFKDNIYWGIIIVVTIIAAVIGFILYRLLKKKSEVEAMNRY